MRYVLLDRLQQRRTHAVHVRLTQTLYAHAHEDGIIMSCRSSMAAYEQTETHTSDMTYKTLTYMRNVTKIAPAAAWLIQVPGISETNRPTGCLNLQVITQQNVEDRNLAMSGSMMS